MNGPSLRGDLCVIGLGLSPGPFFDSGRRINFAPWRRNQEGESPPDLVMKLIIVGLWQPRLTCVPTYPEYGYYVLRHSLRSRRLDPIWKFKNSFH